MLLLSDQSHTDSSSTCTLTTNITQTQNQDISTRHRIVYNNSSAFTYTSPRGMRSFWKLMLKEGFLVLLFVASTDALFENIEFKKIPRSCDFVCEGGGCLYENCEYTASCPGGACDFISSVEPSCSGGACRFVNCIGATCSGGSCNFEAPQDTLRPGYCKGENCFLDAEPHPSFEGGYHTV